MNVLASVLEHIVLLRSGDNDATVRVEFWDNEGRDIKNSDDSPFVELTVSDEATTLAALIDAEGINTATGGIPAGAKGCRIWVTLESDGGIVVNLGGNEDGDGVDAAPTASSPRRLSKGQALEIGSNIPFEIRDYVSPHYQELSDGRHLQGVWQKPALPLITRINTATTTVISATRAKVLHIRCQGGTLGNVKVYRGSVLDPLQYDATPAAGDIIVLGPALSEIGWTIVTAAATILEVVYEPVETW